MISYTKTDKADLERKRPVFYILGYLITIIFILWAFNWKSVYQSDFSFMMMDNPDFLVNLSSYEPVNNPGSEAPLKPVVKKIVKIRPSTISSSNTKKETETPIIIPNAAEETDSKGAGSGTNDGNSPGSGSENGAFVRVEQMPRFVGNLSQYIQQNLAYPPIARLRNVQGVVVVSFIIDENGYPIDIKPVQTMGYGCDEEAIRVIKKMPRWIPGKQHGHNVKVLCRLPIRFSLQPNLMR